MVFLWVPRIVFFFFFFFFLGPRSDEKLINRDQWAAEKWQMLPGKSDGAAVEGVTTLYHLERAEQVSEGDSDCGLSLYIHTCT